MEKGPGGWCIAGPNGSGEPIQGLEWAASNVEVALGLPSTIGPLQKLQYDTNLIYIFYASMAETVAEGEKF